MGEQKKICIDSAVYDEEKMDAWLAKIGMRIRRERISQNLSILKLAELSNLSPSCISKAESNQCGVSLKTLLKIVVALRMPVWELLELEDAEDEEPNSPMNRRFEEITAQAEGETVDFILDMVEQLMKVTAREK